MFRIAPSEAISFISEFYAVLSKNLWEDNDSIIADRGFTIDKELKPLNEKLNSPLFFSGPSQLLKDQTRESQSITH